ncbi:hypothetical protein [Anaerococcus vaginimassiliensis]|uniref:hypothetical protein n=1 Tax=Anaerococcus vaginimassiliensis TaxID=2042308 RepID=UPI001031A846|nr:hypothetical protein [Anaerococcus vaginimassiliensis]
MKLLDFNEKDQKDIDKRLSISEISDKETAEKILDLLPEGWIKKIPIFVRKHSTTKAIEKIAKEHPDLYEVAKKPGDLPEKEKEELKKIITNLFKERMEKHGIK